MAGTRCTAPTAQSASSAYGEGGGKKGKRGGVSYLEERELNKEGEEERKKRSGLKQSRDWEEEGRQAGTAPPLEPASFPSRLATSGIRSRGDE